MDSCYVIEKITNTKAGYSVAVSQVPNVNEESHTFLISPECWKEINRHEGDIISNDEYEEIKSYALLCRAIARALGILANSDCSKSKLVQRLGGFGFSKDISLKCADYIVEHGYIKEDEQTKRIASYYVRSKYWGKKRIAAELLARGYDRCAVLKAIGEIDDETYYESLYKYAVNKYKEPPSDNREKDNRISSLSRLGYSFSEISRVLDELENIYKKENLNEE